MLLIVALRAWPILTWAPETKVRPGDDLYQRGSAPVEIDLRASEPDPAAASGMDRLAASSLGVMDPAFCRAAVDRKGPAARVIWYRGCPDRSSSSGQRWRQGKVRSRGADLKAVLLSPSWAPAAGRGPGKRGRCGRSDRHRRRFAAAEHLGSGRKLDVNPSPITASWPVLTRHPSRAAETIEANRLFQRRGGLEQLLLMGEGRAAIWKPTGSSEPPIRFGQSGRDRDGMAPASEIGTVKRHSGTSSRVAGLLAKFEGKRSARSA